MTSTTEGELLAMSHLVAWLLFWARFFKNIGLSLDQELIVQCDNAQTVRLINMDAPKLVTKLKHIDIHQHWLRQEAQNATIKVQWIPTDQQLADGLTKPLSAEKHAAFLRQLNMVDIRHLIAE